MSQAVPTCIFCQIVAGEKPCHRVFETDLTLSFLDIFPATQGHALVIPKAHYPSILEVTDEAVRDLSSVVRSVAQAIHATHEPDGISVVQANGSAAGQTVMHFHVHAIPRFAGQRLRLHGPRQAQADELDGVARNIISHL